MTTEETGPMVERAARARYEAEAAMYPGDPWPEWADAGDLVREVWRDGIAFTLSWLAEQGRLVPDGARVHEQWSVVFADGFRAEATDRAHALAILDDPTYSFAADGPLQRRTVTNYPDGSVLMTPWVAVPAGEEAP